jgi:hypothetical protein
MNSKRAVPLLIIIILVSFLLRIWGIQFGLPFAYHPDEQQYILPAVGVVSGDFRPLAHYNPALYPYLLGLVYTLTYVGLRLGGAFPDFFNLGAAWSEPMLPWTAGLLYLARYTSVATGLLTTVLIYRLGRRAYGAEAGLGAAIIFGLAFLPAREAHFAVSDAPVALGVTVTLYLCVGIVERGRRATYLWAGVALGLSAATKYSAGLLVVPLGVAHLLSRRYDNWSARLRRAWQVTMAGLAALVSYTLVSPYTWLEREEFWADFSENLTSARVDFQGLELESGGGAIFYLKGLLWGFGWPLMVLFGGAVLFGLWRRRRVDLLLLTLPIFGLWYMQRQEMYFVRWLMPFLPPLAVLAAEAAWTILRPYSPHSLGEGPGVRVYYLFVVTLLTLPSTYVALRADYIFSQPDTRTEALAWIAANIPSGSVLAVEVLSPPWGPPLAAPGLKVGPYPLAPVPDGGVAEVGLAQYREWGVHYIVASSFHYARPLRDKVHQARLRANLQEIAANSELVALFQPYREGYDGYFYHDQVYGPANDALDRRQPGPVITIYRLH